MKRKDALAHIRIAGYHNDQRTALRIYVEHRSVSKTAHDEAWLAGIKAKNAGMPCGCIHCTPTGQQPRGDA